MVTKLIKYLYMLNSRFNLILTHEVDKFVWNEMLPCYTGIDLLSVPKSPFVDVAMN